MSKTLWDSAGDAMESVDNIMELVTGLEITLYHYLLEDTDKHGYEDFEQFPAHKALMKLKGEVMDPKDFFDISEPSEEVGDEKYEKT